MHQTRKESSTKLPIARKGTKYLVRTLGDLDNSVPIMIAVRDILKLAKTGREVQNMINNKMLKLNWKPVSDYHDSIKLFNIFEADKSYSLSLLPTGKFTFNEAKSPSSRLCKVIGKKILNKNLIQLNFHDGSNAISKEKIAVEDSVYLDKNGKIAKHVSLAKGAEVFIIAGRYKGVEGKVESVEGKMVKIKLKDSSSVIPAREAVAL